MTPAEVHEVLAQQPKAKIEYFAGLLGWHGIRLWKVLLSDDDIRTAKLKNALVICYETTDEKFNLQINPHPIGQTRTYRATVKAERYGIANVGWHDFELFDDEETLRREADRLRPWLERRQFKNPKLRREFIAAHPEIPLYPTKERSRRKG
jgi:hypothetical protein